MIEGTFSRYHIIYHIICSYHLQYVMMVSWHMIVKLVTCWWLKVETIVFLHSFMELDDEKIYRKPLYLMVKQWFL